MPIDESVLLRAVSFVETAGDELARLRVGALVGTRPASAVAEWLAQRQAPEGRLALGPGEECPVAATRRGVALLADLGVTRGPVLERASAYLDATQADDGSWPARRAEDRLFETGMLAGLLARVESAPARVLEAAAGHLAARFSPESVQGFRWPAIAAHAVAFANVEHERSDEVLQWCGRELERGYRAGRFDAVETARVLLWCDAPGLPGARLARVELAGAAAAGQADDGGWLAPEAPREQRVERSLDALLALLRLS